MLKRWGTPVEDEEALAQLQKIQEEMGIKNKVRLLHYPMSQSPYANWLQRYIDCITRV